MNGDELIDWGKATSNWSQLSVEMGCTRIHVPGGLLHINDVNVTGTFYNYSLVQDPNDFSLKATEDEFRVRTLPFSVRIPKHESYAELERSLLATGYTRVPVWCMMTHADEVGERSFNVSVEQASPSNIDAWLAVSSIPNLPEGHKTVQQELVRRASQSKSVQLLLARLYNRPVGTGLLYTNDRVASIHLMSTLPEHRRKRVATTVVLKALDLLREQKIELVWLRTRKGGTGQKVYSKLGFTPFVDILSYTRTPDLEQAVAVSQNERQEQGRSPSHRAPSEFSD